jgi:hypothetical protein
MPKNIKKIKETKTNDLVKPMTKEEVKERIWRVNYYEEHPDRIYVKLWKILIKDDIKDWTEDETKYINKYVRSINNFSKSHIWLAETQDEWNLRTSIVELTNNLIEEYNCNTTLEKTLCEIISNSYWKIMQLSKKFTNVMIAWEYITSERTKYLQMLSLELERENRSYLNALNNLIEIKRPSMSISIKTKNAYIWQNQQFNNNTKEDENIKD